MNPSGSNEEMLTEKKEERPSRVDFSHASICRETSRRQPVLLLAVKCILDNNRVASASAVASINIRPTVTSSGASR